MWLWPSEFLLRAFIQAGSTRKGCAGQQAVDGGAPHVGHLRHVGRAALAAFDLDGAHAGGGQLGQQLEGVEAGGLLDGVVGLAIHVEAALAQGGIAGPFAVGEAVDEDAVEARSMPLGSVPSARACPASRRRCSWAIRRWRRPTGRSAPPPSRTARQSRRPRSRPACWRSPVRPGPATAPAAAPRGRCRSGGGRS